MFSKVNTEYKVIDEESLCFASFKTKKEAENWGLEVNKNTGKEIYVVKEESMIVTVINK
ncbi:hypothetical protein ACI2JA_03690 [Alkalihalobacillus sp. NPDC078783]